MNSYYFCVQLSVFTYMGLCKAVSLETAETKIADKFKVMGAIDRIMVKSIGADGFPDFIADFCFQDPIQDTIT